MGGAPQPDGAIVSGYFKPEVSGTFLPGCKTPGCGMPHPLAIKTLTDKTRCPKCKAPAGEQGDTFTEAGAISGGPAVLVGRALLAIGRFLHRRADGV